MRITGLAKIIKEIVEIQDEIAEKAKDVDPSTLAGEKLDERLDEVWTILDDCKDLLEGIKDI